MPDHDQREDLLLAVRQRPGGDLPAEGTRDRELAGERRTRGRHERALGSSSSTIPLAPAMSTRRMAVLVTPTGMTTKRQGSGCDSVSERISRSRASSRGRPTTTVSAPGAGSASTSKPPSREQPDHVPAQARITADGGGRGRGADRQSLD